MWGNITHNTKWEWTQQFDEWPFALALEEIHLHHYTNPQRHDVKWDERMSVFLTREQPVLTCYSVLPVYLKLKWSALKLVQLVVLFLYRHSVQLKDWASPQQSEGPCTLVKSTWPNSSTIQKVTRVTQDNEYSGKSPGRHQSLLYLSDLRLHHSRNYLFCKGDEYKWNLLHVSAVLTFRLITQICVSPYSDLSTTKS